MGDDTVGTYTTTQSCTPVHKPAPPTQRSGPRTSEKGVRRGSVSRRAPVGNHEQWALTGPYRPHSGPGNKASPTVEAQYTLLPKGIRQIHTDTHLSMDESNHESRPCSHCGGSARVEAEHTPTYTIDVPMPDGTLVLCSRECMRVALDAEADVWRAGGFTYYGAEL